MPHTNSIVTVPKCPQLHPPHAISSRRTRETKFQIWNEKQWNWLKNIYLTHSLLFWWHASDDIRIAWKKKWDNHLMSVNIKRIGCGSNWNPTWISNAKCTDTEIFSTRSSQFNIVSGVVMNAGLSQHGVIFYLALPVESGEWIYIWLMFNDRSIVIRTGEEGCY